jgi:phytoene desaturase
MNQDKTAIIIGAGIGGITTAIFLAQNGYKVHVVEKNGSPGGRCGQILRDGHRFDLGATIFLMPEIYREVFRSIGLNLDENFKILPLHALYKIHYEDGTEIAFTTDEDKFKDTLEHLEIGSHQQAKKYIEKGYSLFRLAMKELLGRNFYHFSEFATLKNIFLLLKLKTFRRHLSYIKRFFRHPHLQKAFTFQNIYVGQNPLKAPALFSMLPAAELTEGSMFPEGGMFSITRKLVTMAERLGVTFLYNAPVSKIIASNSRVERIELADGSTMHAAVVVANADLPYVYRELLPDRRAARKIGRMKYTCSAIVLHWALDKTYPQLSHHNVFLSDDYQSNLTYIFRKKSLASNPSFYVHAPVRSDPSAAPPEQDSLSVIIPSGHLDERYSYDWNKLKNAARTSVIARLKKMGLDDIEQYIKFEICYLPQTWKNVYNLTRGATFGSLAHHILQMGYFRPHNRHKKYKNLYFAGGSTHPGNGVPLVLLSAKLTSERILKDMQHDN